MFAGLKPTNLVLRLVFSAAVSLLILTLLLRLVGGEIDAATRPGLLSLLSKTLVGGVATYIVLSLAGLVLRAIRYRKLIAAANESVVPSLFHMGLVTGVRNMMVDMLPGRVGELMYVALLNRGYRVSSAVCLASLSIAVVFDFVALGLIVVIAIATSVATGNHAAWLWGALSVSAVAIAAAVFSLTRLLPMFNRLVQRRTANASAKSLRRRFATLIEDLDRAVQTTARSGTLGQIFALSMVIRVLKYAALYSLFVAVAQPVFPVLAAASWEKILAAIVGSEIGASLPVPALMSFGTYEAGGTLALSMLGFSESDSLLALLGLHIWSQGIDYAVGGVCFILFILLIRSRVSVNREPPGQWRKVLAWSLAGALALSALAVLALQYRSNAKLGATSAPPSGQDVASSWAPQLHATYTALTDQRLRGFIVWSSNRSGNHDILKMSLPDGKITALTSHAHTETWPRVSDSGRRLVFARSREPWVSQRNAVAWDVILLDLDSGDETRLAEFASYPFWINRDTVGYLSGGTSIVRHNVETGHSERVFEPGDNNHMHRGTPITSPDLPPDGNDAVFTAKQSAIGMQTGFWGTALWRRNEREVLGVLDGCELNWSYDGSTLYQVGHGGRQKTMFYRIDPGTLRAEPLLDLPGEFSHEYWPEDSNDGRYLVFGASRGDHEHDSADYEIFLWQIGQPADSALRLTYHTGNDNWPDIYIE